MIKNKKRILFFHWPHSDLWKYTVVIFRLMAGLPILLLIMAFNCTGNKASENNIQIKIDERVNDFCSRMEIRRLFKCKELESVAGSDKLRKFTFLNHNIAGLKKFEGAFRPGYYTFSYKTSLEKFVLDLLEVSNKRYLSYPQNNLNIRDAIILASIVEKEAVSNRDYKKIARVFLNRLKKNEPLGSCPTVEYALGFHRPFLLYKDLKMDSPYNVYKRKGLPPTAIAFFSKKALDAVFFPVQSQDYFFVYDWTTGNLHFTPGYQTHKKNANRARKNFIKKYGKKVMYQPFYDKFYENI